MEIIITHILVKFQINWILIKMEVQMIQQLKVHHIFQLKIMKTNKQNMINKEVNLRVCLKNKVDTRVIL